VGRNGFYLPPGDSGQGGRAREKAGEDLAGFAGLPRRLSTVRGRSQGLQPSIECLGSKEPQFGLVRPEFGLVTDSLGLGQAFFGLHRALFSLRHASFGLRPLFGGLRLL